MQTTKPAFRLPLAARIFLVCGGLITAAILAAVAVTYSQGRKIADASVESALSTSVSVQDAAKQAQLDQIQTLVSFIAQDPAVVQYFASSTDSVTDAGLFGETETVDPLATGSVSLADLLSERQSQYPFALGIFLDDQGNVLARTDEQEAVQESLRDDAFLQPAISDVQPISGFWRQGATLYQAAITPVQRDEDLLGFLLLAQAVDDTFAMKVGDISGAHIAYLFPGSPVKVVSSSLSDEQAQDLAKNLGPDSVAGKAIETAQSVETLELTLGSGKWIGRLRPVDADAGPHLGSALLLTSADRAYAGFQRILNLVLAAGPRFTGVGASAVVPAGQGHFATGPSIGAGGRRSGRRQLPDARVGVGHRRTGPAVAQFRSAPVRPSGEKRYRRLRDKPVAVSA
ncbi:MAG: hypothetical protein IPK97_13645 [Ahniella sp.]|nr:hypothetical protein [Ahniella sp.]